MKPMWKKVGVVKKTLLILCLLIMGLTVGNGIHAAAGGKTIPNQLADWFELRTKESISEMDQAINAEKNLLMDGLRVELRSEVQRAQTELNTHTSLETAKAIQALQNYAAELSAGLHVSNEAEKQAVSNSINAALNEAMAIINNSAIVPKVPPISNPEAKEEEEVVQEKEPVEPPLESNPEPTPVEDEKPSVTEGTVSKGEPVAD